MKIYHCIGLMSGSSLDGLDLAYCRFEFDNQQITNWELLAAETLPYSEMWVERLKHLPSQSGLILHKSHIYYAEYTQELLDIFIKKYQIKTVDFISWHGHTVFHSPQLGYSLQLGSGAVLASKSGIDVITDFRQQDISAGGQGAPLAPFVDKVLWNDCNFCLNIGGIANLSANLGEKYIGFDVCYANQILNRLAQELGFLYDNSGNLARQGKIDENLLAELKNLPFFGKKYPKSMSNEEVLGIYWPVFEQARLEIADKLATATAHIGYEIGKACQKIISIEKLNSEKMRMLATGGGVFNSFLMEHINQNLPKELMLSVPDEQIIKFKEAVLMAVLGLYRLENIPNTLTSVTGARRTSIAGAVYVGR